MHFYVDETGHTGPNLFDRTQPVLSYGVLSSPDDLRCTGNSGHYHLFFFKQPSDGISS